MSFKIWLYKFSITISFLVVITNCDPIPNVKTNTDDKSEIPLVLLVSYDGFRNEYFKRNVTDYFNKLRMENVYTDHILNIFPTKTFPNHFSMVTGVSANVHGVTANQIYDFKLNKTLGYDYDIFHYNKNLTPIWILNQMAGPKRYSGCMMYPGGEYEYNNDTCKFFVKFDRNMAFEDRVDQGIDWFTHPETPANLVLLYFEDPDYTSHAYGTDNVIITEIIRKLDGITERIQKRLIEKNLAQRVNVIHLSDHGMGNVKLTDTIDLDKILGKDTYTYYGTSPILQIVPNKGYETKVLNALELASQQMKTFRVFTNENFPKHWKYVIQQRTGPITLMANENYGFQDLILTSKRYEHYLNTTFPAEHTVGVHGYEPEVESMHPIFMAKGPAFKENYKMKPFHNTEIMFLMCKLLNISAPPETEGKLENVIEMLKSAAPQKRLTPSAVSIVALSGSVIAISFFVLCYTIFVCSIQRRKNKLNLLPMNDAGVVPDAEEERFLIDSSDPDV